MVLVSPGGVGLGEGGGFLGVKNREILNPGEMEDRRKSRIRECHKMAKNGPIFRGPGPRFWGVGDPLLGGGPGPKNRDFGGENPRFRGGPGPGGVPGGPKSCKVSSRMVVENSPNNPFIRNAPVCRILGFFRVFSPSKPGSRDPPDPPQIPGPDPRHPTGKTLTG